MSAIWKYPLEIVDRQTIAMPEGCRILSAQFQGWQLCLWAMVDPERPTQDVVIAIFSTGHQIPSIAWVRYEFIATVQDGSLVRHVFRVDGKEGA